MRRKPSRAPRRPLPQLLLVASLVAASCRFNYEELAAPDSGGSGGNDPSNGGSAPGQAGEVQSAGASETPVAGSPGTAGASSLAGSSAAGDAGAATAGAGGAEPVVSIECGDQADCGCVMLDAHSYRFCKKTLNWTDAEAACETQSMHLARIDTQEENDFLVSAGGPFGVFALNGFAQIGANDQAVAGEWRWVDGTLFWQGGPAGAAVDGLFSNWLASSPSSSGVQQCSGILSSGKWQVRSCTAVVPFICEAP